MRKRASIFLVVLGLWAASAFAQTSTNPTDNSLVGGAPLTDPNVAVHVVEQKQFKDANRSEIVLYPAVAQLNGEYTQHFGTALTYVYHLGENFGLTLSPIYNWYARDSAFNRELNNSISGEAKPASSLLLNYGAHAGVEVVPLYGKFAFYDGIMARFSLVVHAGAGVASTEHELKEGNQFGPTTYGDTGMRLLMAGGAGLRVQIGDRFTMRLEVNDLAYSARVDRVNGCSEGDLTTLVNEQAAGQPLSQGTVSSSCKVSSFSGTDPKSGYAREGDLRTALDLTADRSSDVLNNIGFYAGVGVEF